MFSEFCSISAPSCSFEFVWSVVVSQWLFSLNPTTVMVVLLGGLWLLLGCENITLWKFYPSLHCGIPIPIPTYIAVFVSCVKHLNMKTSIPPYENSIPSYVVLFLSLLALQFLASCLKHWYENIYPTLHCTFPCVPVTFLPFSEFYPTLYCGISLPTCIADFNLMCKTLILEYISHLILWYFLLMKNLSHLVM